MSHEDPKNTGMPEDKVSENTTSRRRFLEAGAAAAVGAMAAAVVPKAAEAQPETAADVGVLNPNGTRVTPTPPDPELDDILASIIVRAWNDPSFRDKLLSNPKGTLTAEKVPGADDVNVLTRARYHTGYVRTLNQVIYVLPDRPLGLTVSVNLAKAMMQVTPFGM